MLEEYARYEYLLASAQVVLVMLGMGATLTLRDFLAVARRPFSLLLGCLSQFAICPLMAIVVQQLWGLEPGIAVGLILISAMPGGPIANLFTFIGRGNVALSIALTAIGAIGSIVTVPLLLQALAGRYVGSHIAMPMDTIIREVFVFLLIPIHVGMLVAKIVPAYAKVFSTICVRLGVAILIAIIVGSTGSGQIRPGDYGWSVPIAIIVTCLLAQNINVVAFKLLKRPPEDEFAATVAVTIRNVNLALLLKARLFPAAVKGSDPIADGILFVILFYGAVSLIVSVPSVLLHLKLTGSGTSKEAP